MTRGSIAGNDLALPKKRNWLLIFIGSLVGGAILVGGALVAFVEWQASKLTPDDHMGYDSQRVAQATIRAGMRDPESAVFRNVQRGATPRVVCGEVNGQNGYGGMTGFRHFVVSYDSGIAAMEGDGAFDLAWSSSCGNWHGGF